MLLVSFATATACGGTTSSAIAEQPDAALSADAGRSDGAPSGHQPNAIAGSANGIELHPVEYVRAYHINFADRDGMMLRFSDLAGACDRLLDNHPIRGETELTLSVLQGGAYSLAFWVGTTVNIVPIGQAFDADRSVPTAWAQFSSYDSSCQERAWRLDATDGTVTLTDVRDNSVSGIFSAHFPSGELHGSFTATTCAPDVTPDTSPLDCAP